MRKLISDHYDLLRVSNIKDYFLQRQGFGNGKKKKKNTLLISLFKFVEGPDYFNQSRGAPMMVGRHADF